MSSYGDGNTYRGTSCKDSEVPTHEISDYRSCTPTEELELSRAVERDLRERICELESALAELAEWARDIAGDCADPIQRQQEDEMIERINKILEQPR